MAPLPTLMVSPLTVTVAREAAVHTVKAQQMRIGFHRSEIVDADDLDILALGLGNGAQDIAADAAKPIDGNTDSHRSRSRIFNSVMAEMAPDGY